MGTGTGWTRFLGARPAEAEGVERDDPQALYADLHGLATRLFRREPGPQTLQPTALVHEALLRLADERHDGADRARLLAAAARTMRRLLIDRARRRRLLLEGFREESHESAAALLRLDGLLDLESGLERLGAAHPELRELVELRWFAGLSTEEIAREQGVSPRTVKRRWQLALASLQQSLEVER